MDCLYGNSKEFLEGISDNYWYFADIHHDALVWRDEPIFEVPDYKGRGPRPTKMAATTPAEHVSKIAGDETIPWVKMYLGSSDGSIACCCSPVRRRKNNTKGLKNCRLSSSS